MKLFSRRHEKPVFDLFGDLAQLIVSGSDVLSRTLGESPGDRERTAPGLHELSIEGGDLAARIANRLAAALVTPSEAEVLHALAMTLCDTLDAMDRTADLATRFGIRGLQPGLLEVCPLIERAADLTVQAVWKLGDVSGLHDFVGEMRRVERHGDQLLRQARVDLYASGRSGAELLQERDVAEGLADVLALVTRISRTADLLRVKDA